MRTKDKSIKSFSDCERKWVGLRPAATVRLMRKFRWFCLSALLIGPLSGCFPLSAMDVLISTAPLILSLPAPGATEKVDLSGYSLGPISSDEAQELILSAVPAIEGEVYFTGRAEWSGLKDIKQPTSQLNQSIVAITDFQILFIWWRESDERYKILIRLPYSDIYSVNLNSFIGAMVWFCHESNEVLIDDQVIFIDRKTNFNFTKKSGLFGDAEKTKEAFQLLNKKVMPKEGSEHLPSPCEEVVLPDGEDDFTGQA